MLLSTFLLSQLGTIGAGSSFFVLCCVLLSTIPFLFDGLMSLISLVQQNVLQAVGTERHERPREQEDSFQVEGGQLRTTQSVAYVLPEAVLRNPELADRLTSNWKDSAFLNSNRIQITGFFIIVLFVFLLFSSHPPLHPPPFNIRNNTRVSTNKINEETLKDTIPL